MLNYIWKKRLVISIISLLIIATLVPTISSEDKIYYHAIYDIEVTNGQIMYTFENTYYDDNAYQGLKEKLIGGQKNGKTILEHIWVFNITGGDYSFELYLRASAIFENFVFAYSTDNIDYTDLLTVEQNLGGYLQTASLGDDLDGLVYIRVQDTVRVKGDTTIGEVYVDYLNIEATPGEDCPIISNVLALENTNVWVKKNPNILDGDLYKREFISHQMVYDSNAEKTILFSGYPDKGWIKNDIWEYDYVTNTWTNKTPTMTVIGGPLYGRCSSAMSYDSSAQKIIMFGGRSYTTQSVYLSDTWEYDYNSNTWTNLTSYLAVNDGILTTRHAHAMAYDSESDKTIMFRGAINSTTVSDETWAFDYSSKTWTNKTPSQTVINGQLPEIGHFGMVYVPTVDRIILFGGVWIGGYSNETWEYDYNTNTWTNLTPDINVVGDELATKWAHGMVYDSVKDRIVLFGGETGQSDESDETWVFNYYEKTWQKVVNPLVKGQNFYKRTLHGMVFDSYNQVSIIFGGFLSGTVGMLNDTWEFILDVPSAAVTWETDEPSDSEVHFGISSPSENTISDDTLTLSHSILLTNLDPNTQYLFEVQSTDQSSNTAVDNNGGEYYTFTTTQPPVISNIAADEVTHSTATITWDTDEPSNSEIHYGTTIPPGNIISDSPLVINHSLQLTYLEPVTTYYYEVQSTDYSGRTTIDDNGGSYYSFTTSTEPSNSMLVQSIDMWYYQQGQKFKLYTIVQIVDENDEPVDNAMVYLSINRTIGSFTRIVYESNDLTNSTGYVTFFYETKIKSLYTATVNDVVKEGWTYHPEDNVETSESIYVK